MNDRINDACADNNHTTNDHTANDRTANNNATNNHFASELATNSNTDDQAPSLNEHSNLKTIDAFESRIMQTIASRANSTTMATALSDSAMRREQAIRTAVETSLPKRVTLWSTLVEARGSMRFRDLFFGVWDCVAVALIMTATIWIIPLIRLFTDTQHVLTQPGIVYAIAFLTAPFLYVTTHVLVRVKEHENHTNELLRAMRWSFTRLCALRMLVMGATAATLIVGYAIILNAVGSRVSSADGVSAVTMLAEPIYPAHGSTTAALGAVNTANAATVSNVSLSLMTLLGVAFSALFVFGIAQLTADVYASWPWSMIVVPAFWIALCAALFAYHDALAPLLANLPPLVALISAIVTGVAYFAAMQRFIRLSPAIARFA